MKSRQQDVFYISLLIGILFFIGGFYKLLFVEKWFNNDPVPGVIMFCVTHGAFIAVAMMYRQYRNNIK